MFIVTATYFYGGVCSDLVYRDVCSNFVADHAVGNFLASFLAGVEADGRVLLCLLSLHG